VKPPALSGDLNDESIESHDPRIMRKTRQARSPHLPNGVYYVVRRSGHTGQPIFRDALDYAIFERLLALALALALARYRFRLHAFYWEPDANHMAMQVSGMPIGRFLQWL
jgi:hypothetical protein